jgi:hypothetical protein
METRELLSSLVHEQDVFVRRQPWIEAPWSIVMELLSQISACSRIQARFLVTFDAASKTGAKSCIFHCCGSQTPRSGVWATRPGAAGYLRASLGAHRDTARVWSSAFTRFGVESAAGRLKAELQTLRPSVAGAVSGCARSLREDRERLGSGLLWQGWRAAPSAAQGSVAR